jgi:hypothetical protein
VVVVEVDSVGWSRFDAAASSVEDGDQKQKNARLKAEVDAVRLVRLQGWPQSFGSVCGA